MAPPRAARTTGVTSVADDARSEASSTRERHAATHPHPKRGKEKSAGTAGATTSGLAHGKDAGVGAAGSGIVGAAPGAVDGEGTVAAAGGEGGVNGAPGISWPTLPTPLLHAYRQAHSLPVPSSFSSAYNGMILSQPGSIGRYSPTMARRKEKRRVSKETLAMAVRKNFNGLAVQEGDVVVGFLYKVRFQDRNFRMRFAPKGR
ncbi:MAG: hypothetical protein M1819_003660 [Sarea resinae]|nr:MAG: hypothetical protein M1819_003660 [Sarea resinae]